MPRGTFPTNLEIELAGCLILEVQQGKFASTTAYTDRTMLQEQLNLEQAAA